MARTLDIRCESRFAKDHDRNEWVAATAILSLMIRSSMAEPPWPKVGFVPDNETPLYDRRTDFNEFIFKKAAEFEQAVVVTWQRESKSSK